MSIAYNSRIVNSNLVLYVDAANPKSYPGTGNIWYDLSGNGENLTLYNSPTFSSNSSGELLFSGANDYARITNSNAIDSLASAGTIDFWFRTISNTLGVTYARLVSFSDTAGTGSDSSSTQGINKDYSNFLCLAKNNTTESLALWYKSNPAGWGPATLLNTNSYFQVTLTWATIGSNMTFNFYLNGVSSLTTTVAQSGYGSSGSTITLGQNCAGALTNPLENSSCAFSSFRLYNRSLTPEEVRQNFNAARGRYGI